ncbi:hypothetical protein K7957_04975 [Sphingomonas yunnanensis]|uniref:hypothetical protein n=1 Tax=Sphingomonas yunnanensis TaxID=310400 RepID=UPI001CA686C9|nr:hypothetical protein [Sphingomonas yunnanensis]MBY9062281.1 hypothetical protein [Sphingomonas yunnanensis]
MPDDSPQLTPEALATWTDQELLTGRVKTTWELGDPAIDALAAEVARRELDF